MKLLKSYKVKGSSILESVVAIAIISICVFIASLVYVTLLDTDYNIAYYKARQQVNKMYYDALENELFEDEIVKKEGYHITKTVKEETALVKRVTFVIQAHKKKETIHYLIPYTGFEEE